MRAYFIVAAFALSILTCGFTPWLSGTAVVPANPTFALPTGSTLKYADPSGNDACNGTSPTLGSSGNCAWATANHAMNCGEVIIAAAGTYNQAFSQWGVVSNCPSTSGGIDTVGGVPSTGSGGIYAAALLCGGSDLGASGCKINCATAACAGGIVGTGGYGAAGAAMNNNQSYWTVQGWTVNGNGTSRGFQTDNCLTTSTIIHHISYINDIVVNAAQGYDTDDCGYGVSATNGGDYTAFVGSIAQNAVQDPICLGAFDVVGPGQLDANAGTHYYIYGDFSYANQNVACTLTSDNEDYMFDTWDAHNVGTTGVIANSVGFYADRMCIQIFQQNDHTNTPTIKVHNVTCFQDNISTGNDNQNAEIQFQSQQNPSGIVISATNNIAFQPLAKSGHVAQGGTAGVATTSYNNSTGALTLTFGTGAPLGSAPSVGAYVRVGGFSGTGTVANLTGNWPIASSSGSGTSIVFTATAGLCSGCSITNASGIILPGGMYVNGTGVFTMVFSTAPAGASPTVGSAFNIFGAYGGIGATNGVVLTGLMTNVTLLSSSASGTVLNFQATSGLGNLSVWEASIGAVNSATACTGGSPPIVCSAGRSNVAFLATTLFSTYSNTGNFWKANQTACVGAFCDTGFNTVVFSPGTIGELGTSQSYTDPAFTSTTDLLTNQLGIPNCTGFENATQCMGYNASTATLTAPSIISDLVPTAGGSASDGYQLPSLTCAANSDYPTWLKGIAYLHWNGTTITENAGLVTKPCGY